ncbi:MAG: IS3 family transposase [Eggerthellaceae bacterium]
MEGPFCRRDRLPHVTVQESVANPKAFGDSGGTYGYRRLLPEVNGMDGIKAGEWTVRRIMREEGLAARNPKRRRKYSSYAGEVSEAPGNTCLDDRGRHHFDADAPNELWVTDITEFRIPAGKCYLSPVIDCFDGMPIGWSIGSSPTAELANSSLLQACSQLREGEHPRGHTDRGGHYRWPGWIGICDDYGIVRSMSRKGHSPDNSRMEGFFGRLKVEFFYGRDWQGVTMDEFMGMLDGYMIWYRDRRRKSDLGYVSPMQYRRNLGLAA